MYAGSILVGLMAAASAVGAASVATDATKPNLWNVTNLSIVGSGPVGSKGSVKFSFNVDSPYWSNTACSGSATSDQPNTKCPGAQDITGFTNTGTCKNSGVSFVFDEGSSSSGTEGYYLLVQYKNNGNVMTGCKFLPGTDFKCGKNSAGPFESYTGPKSVQIDLNAPGAGCPAPPPPPAK